MLEIQVCEDREAWDDYILDHGGHPLQLWGWGELKRLHGWQADRLFIYKDEAIVAAASVLTKKLPLPFKALSYIPRGPVGELAENTDALNLISDFCKENRKSVALSIEPDTTDFKLDNTWQQSPNSILPNLTVQLDLTKTESELLAVMAKKTRQYIRKSAADVEVKRVKNLQELNKCLEIYQQTSRRAKFDLHSMDYYRHAFQKMGENSIIYGAYKNGEVVAFLWIVISAKQAFELYGGMSEEGSELRANYALKWQAIKDCKSWGLEIYDFGGIIGEGIATFKRSWTDHDTVLAGSFDKSLSPYYSLWSKTLPHGKRAVQRLRRGIRKASNK